MKPIGKPVILVAALMPILILVVAAAVLPETTERDRYSQVKSCSDMRVLAAAIDAYATDNKFYPSSDRQLLSDERLGAILGSSYLPAKPQLDPWGNPYLYWSNHHEYFLLGTGGDGQQDMDYLAALGETQEARIVTLASLCERADPAPGADIVYTGGRFCKLPTEVAYGSPGKSFSEADRQALTMKNIRAAATSVEEYAIDNNIYPVLVRGSAMVGSLKPLLEPNYIKVLPVADGWGQGMLYWSNGDHYVIQSQVAGMDRDYGHYLGDAKDVEVAIKEICKGATDDPRADIVFIDGRFCQWPTGQPAN